MLARSTAIDPDERSTAELIWSLAVLGARHPARAR
jgi:hypothetical protein